MSRNIYSHLWKLPLLQPVSLFILTTTASIIKMCGDCFCKQYPYENPIKIKHTDSDMVNILVNNIHIWNVQEIIQTEPSHENVHREHLLHAFPLKTYVPNTMMYVIYFRKY
jgi:hypothetical protein